MLTFLFWIRKPCFLAGFGWAKVSLSVYLLVQYDSVQIGAATTKPLQP